MSAARPAGADTVLELRLDDRVVRLRDGDVVTIGRHGVDLATRIARGMDPISRVVELDADPAISRIWCELSVTAAIARVRNLSESAGIDLVTGERTHHLAPRHREVNGALSRAAQVAVLDDEFAIELTAVRVGKSPRRFRVTARSLLPHHVTVVDLDTNGRARPTVVPAQEVAQHMRRRPAQWDTLRELTWEYRHPERVQAGRAPRPLSNPRIARRLGLPVGTVENRLSELARNWMKLGLIDTELSNEERRAQMCERAVVLDVIARTAELAGWPLGPDA